MKNYIAIRNVGGVVDRLVDMGYKKHLAYNYDGYLIFIVILMNHGMFGSLVTFGDYDYRTDIKMDIDDLPLFKDLEEWVKVYNEGNKMGLL